MKLDTKHCNGAETTIKVSKVAQGLLFLFQVKVKRRDWMVLKTLKSKICWEMFLWCMGFQLAIPACYFIMKYMHKIPISAACTSISLSCFKNAKFYFAFTKISS